MSPRIRTTPSGEIRTTSSGALRTIPGTSRSQLERVQEAIYGRLCQVSWFDDVSVLLARPRTQEEATLLQTEIDRMLAGMGSVGGAFGAAVIVQLPSASVPEANIPGPQFELTYPIVVIEHPVVNMGDHGTQKSAEDLALAVHNALHHTVLLDIGSTLVSSGEALVPVQDDEGRIGYECMIRVQLGLVPPTKCAIPQITGSAAAVSLQSATSGAEIWYTIDGSYPHSDNDQASRYSDPFDVSVGTTVRAVALNTTYHPSDLAAKTITS